MFDSVVSKKEDMKDSLCDRHSLFPCNREMADSKGGGVHIIISPLDQEHLQYSIPTYRCI